MSQPESTAPPEAESPGVSSAVPESAVLAARYGRTPGTARRTRLVVVASALAFVAVFAAWLVWGGLAGPQAQFDVQDVGHTVVSDSEVSVTWNITVEPGTPMRCAVQGLNSTFAIVGWLVVDVPASTERTRAFTQTVRTTERAVTGLIYQCWLT